LTLPLQDMAEGVSDVRMMHDDVSEGMKQLKVFFADKLMQVTVFFGDTDIDGECDGCATSIYLCSRLEAYF
jgi:hypothetical protein